jgi:uncharacterized protein (TIGR02594 family)
MSKLLEIAIAEIGVKEILGPHHNSTILQYAHEAGFDWVNDDETPWCSIFVNWCAHKAGLNASGKANARSWLLVGMPVENPEPGDIVVFWRGSIDSWQGHVGFFMGFDRSGERIYTLGGNQGNQVSISAYPANKLLGFRRLKAGKTLVLPEPVLKRSDTGEVVKQLQDALKLAGFNPGTSDGVFGELTESAVRLLQSAMAVKVNGEYNAETAGALSDALSA